MTYNFMLETAYGEMTKMFSQTVHWYIVGSFTAYAYFSKRNIQKKNRYYITYMFYKIIR